ncbi:hypothetical protein E2C01_039593 [Portunus trituberculatus]|uniref:Uncharacterized protein n=1 Tax=Portunus trituberculatus TaxID=210409 RepID=A0A5B7FK72_PORTR|nr:hypothetical protein [Portunus trituberculatus]
MESPKHAKSALYKALVQSQQLEGCEKLAETPNFIEDQDRQDVKFSVKIMCKGQTKDIQCRRGRQLSVIKKEGIVGWKIVLS